MKKTPSKLEEVLEKGVHLAGRNDLRKQGEVPICGENLNIHPDFLQVVIKICQVNFHQLCDQCAVFNVSRQALHVDIANFVVFDQGYK